MTVVSQQDDDDSVYPTIFREFL